MKETKKDKSQWLKTFFVIFFICLVIFAVRYSGYGISDTNEGMALVYHDANPSAFKNDWFVNSASDFNVRVWYSLLINLTNSFVGDYEITSMLVLFLCTFVFSLGFYKIMFLLTKNHKLSLFSIIFPLIIKLPGIGGYSFHMPDFLIPSKITWAIIIWVVYFYLKENYVLSFFLLGFSSLFHVALGFLIYLVLILSLIFKNINPKNKWYNKDELGKKLMFTLKSFSFLVFFSVVAAPLFLSGQKTIEAVPPDKLIHILKFRAPWHFNTLKWPLSFWFFSFVLLGLFLIAFKRSRINKKYKNTLKILVIIILLSYLLQFIFVDLIPTSFIIKIFFYRLNEFLNVIEFIFIAELFYNKINEEENFIVNLYKKDKRILFLIFLVILIIINLTVLGFYPHLYYFNKIFLKLFLAILFVILILVFSIKIEKIKNILIILLIVGLLVYLFYNPLIGRNKYDEETENMFSYIKENTPKDATLLIPPYIGTFRIGTERAIVIDFKAFSYASMLEWYDRILDVTNSQDKKFKADIEFDNIKNNYNNLTKGDIIKLRRKYDFSYAIFEKPKVLPFPIIYEGKRFVAYKID